jgi:hypothetical protein
MAEHEEDNVEDTWDPLTDEEEEDEEDLGF